MDTLSAFVMGEANRGKARMVFDWDKAARLIREQRPSNASAGLRGDWEYTGGPIYKNGSPVLDEDTYTYLASTWAVPELDMDGERIDCYRMEDETPGWGSSTYWPESARKILEAA